MSWLANKPQASEGVQLYSIGLNKTYLLVGLGNPGNEYDLTRHNIGFKVLDDFVSTSDEMSDWIHKKDLKCHLSSGQFGQNRVIAVKPTTYMNLSGEAVQAAASFYKIPAESVVAIHDELDIDFGQIRMRSGGNAAGHNGIKSITQHIGERYGRMRIGIGPKQPPQIDSADFVLQRFSTAEQAQLGNLSREAIAIINEYLYGGTLPHDTRSFIV